MFQKSRNAGSQEYTLSFTGLGSEDCNPLNMSIEAELVIEQMKEQHHRDLRHLKQELEDAVSYFHLKIKLEDAVPPSWRCWEQGSLYQGSVALFSSSHLICNPQVRVEAASTCSAPSRLVSHVPYSSLQEAVASRSGSITN